MTTRVVKPESERFIQRQVVTFLRDRGWFAQIYSGSIKAMPGLAGHPDILALHGHGIYMMILYVECKRKGGELRPSQIKWKERAKRILNAGCVYYMIAEATEFDDFKTRYYANFPIDFLLSS
jgi:hypothetical protein